VSFERNIVANFASQGYLAALNLALLPFYVSYMGAEGYGLIGFFATLQAWFMLLDFGLSQTLVREAARFRGGVLDPNRFRGLVLAIEIGFAAVAIAGAAALIGASFWIATDWLRLEHLGAREVAEAVALMACIAGFQLMTAPQRSVIAGFERQEWLGAFTIVSATARFVAIVPLFWWLGATPRLFFGYQLAVSVVESAVLAWKARQVLLSIPVTHQVRPSIELLRANSGFALTIAFTSSVWLVVTYSDRLLLSRILSLSDFAYFAIAVSAAGLINLVGAPLSLALLPKLAGLASRGEQHELIRLYRRSTQLVCVLAFPAALSLAFFSRLVLSVWTGDAELVERAWPILSTYAIGNALLAVAAFPYYLQYAHGNVRLHLYGNIVFLLFFLPILFWATVAYGAIGAAAAWTAANLGYLVLWVPLVHRRFAPGMHLKWLARDVLSIALPVTLCCGLLFLLLPQQGTTRVAGLLWLAMVAALALATAFLSSTVGVSWSSRMRRLQRQR
jgi:O-antigen/teichoic acid export membrane protein